MVKNDKMSKMTENHENVLSQQIKEEKDENNRLLKEIKEKAQEMRLTWDDYAERIIELETDVCSLQAEKQQLEATLKVEMEEWGVQRLQNEKWQGCVTNCFQCQMDEAVKANQEVFFELGSATSEIEQEKLLLDIQSDLKQELDNLEEICQEVTQNDEEIRLEVALWSEVIHTLD